MQLTKRELATVLAALRERQGILLGQKPPEEWISAVASDAGSLDPLTADEIDGLCQRLNTKEQAPQQPKVYYLQTLGLEIPVKDKGGKVVGSLAQRMYGDGEARDDLKENALLDQALETLEGLILAHACAGINVSATAYLEGVETVLEVLANAL